VPRLADVVRLEHVLAPVLLRDLDLGGREQLTAALVQLDALLSEVRVVHPVQPPDVGIPLGLERGPVELRLTDTRAGEVVALGVTNLVGDVGGMPHNLWVDVRDYDASRAYVNVPSWVRILQG
jgi:hypothetical protein